MTDKLDLDEAERILSIPENRRDKYNFNTYCIKHFPQAIARIRELENTVDVAKILIEGKEERIRELEQKQSSKPWVT